MGEHEISKNVSNDDPDHNHFTEIIFHIMLLKQMLSDLRWEHDEAENGYAQVGIKEMPVDKKWFMKLIRKNLISKLHYLKN